MDFRPFPVAVATVRHIPYFAAVLVALAFFAPAPALAQEAGTAPEAAPEAGEERTPEEMAAALQELLQEAAGEGSVVEVRVEGAPTLRQRADAIDRPRVGPRVDVGPRLQVGRGTFEIPSGTPVHLLLAGGEPAGVLIDGRATFVYRVEDRFSMPVAKRNLGEGASLSSDSQDGALVIREPVRSAAIWSWQIGASAAPEGAAQEGVESAKDGPGLPAPLGAILADGLFQPPSNTLLMDRAVEDADAMAYVLADGEGEDLLLSVDPVLATHETLAVVTGVSRFNTLQRGQRTLFRIADQPIGRQWWEREEARSPHVLVHQSISLDNPEGRRVISTSTSRVQARRGGVSVWAPTVEETSFGDDKLFPVLVEEVTVNGQPADFLHRGHQLLVDLGEPLGTGRSVEVGVRLQGELAIRPGNDNYWTPAGSWRPSSGLDGELATFDIELRVPEPYVPFASGDTLERRQEDGFNVLRSRVDEPTQFPVVAAGKYHVFSKAEGGVECNVATYVFGKKKPAEVLQGLFFSGAQIFEQFFGVPYPFEEVDVVEVNQWGWAQAPAGVIFITQEAYNPLPTDTARFYSQGINARFLHEVAHGWWGHVVKTDSAEEQWITESFADYAAALAMKVIQPGKRGEREFDKILRQWKSEAEFIGAGDSIYLANYLDSRDPTDVDNDDRYRLLYNKGPYVLHALRQELGRQAGGAEQGDRYFQALLRAFTTNFQGGYGETRHLVGILNQMTGSDWQPWFEKYVYGTEMPPVEM